MSCLKQSDTFLGCDLFLASRKRAWLRSALPRRSPRPGVRKRAATERTGGGGGGAASPWLCVCAYVRVCVHVAAHGAQQEELFIMICPVVDRQLYEHVKEALPLHWLGHLSCRHHACINRNAQPWLCALHTARKAHSLPQHAKHLSAEILMTAGLVCSLGPSSGFLPLFVPLIHLHCLTA